MRVSYSNHGDGKSPVLPRHIQSLRVMTRLELNVVNAAKRVIAAEDDGTLAGERRYAGAYARLVAAVLALTMAEQRERRERTRGGEAKARLTFSRAWGMLRGCRQH